MTYNCRNFNFFFDWLVWVKIRSSFTIYIPRLCVASVYSFFFFFLRLWIFIYTLKCYAHFSSLTKETPTRHGMCSQAILVSTIYIYIYYICIIKRGERRVRLVPKKKKMRRVCTVSYAIASFSSLLSSLFFFIVSSSLHLIYSQSFSLYLLVIKSGGYRK